jgi:hypothetical protein
LWSALIDMSEARIEPSTATVTPPDPGHPGGGPWSCLSPNYIRGLPALEPCNSRPSLQGPLCSDHGGQHQRRVDPQGRCTGNCQRPWGFQSGISKSQVSRVCQEIDQQVQAFLSRPLQESGDSYVFLDATLLKGRLVSALQVCSAAVAVAMGVMPTDPVSCPVSRSATARPKPSERNSWPLSRSWA